MGMRLLWLFILMSLFCAAGNSQDTRPGVEIPLREGNLVIHADEIEKTPQELWVGTGNVVATFSETTLLADEAVYNPSTGEVQLEGNIEVKRGTQWLKGTRAELNLDTQLGVIFDAEGFTDQELFVKAKTLTRIGPETWLVEDGFLTACSQALPKWSFTAPRATIRDNSSARIRNTIFRVKQFPVFYLPYLIIPTEKKTRSSGFLLPSTGNSNNRGRRISQAFYLVLGRSADMTIREEFFSKRGFGHGVNFRARPNDRTSLDLSSFFVNDRLDQGGTSLQGTAESRFENGFRAVADFNLVTSFTFRQVFSDSFFDSTRPTDNSRFFLTNNFGLGSLNVLVAREETIFPQKNIITRTTPSLQFKLTGLRPFDVPLFFDLETRADGVSRTDSRIDTSNVTERFDFFPQLYFSVPLFQGLRLSPRLGFRETYYGERLLLPEEVDGPDAGRLDKQSLSREYLDFTLDLKGWALSKVYRSSGGGGWKHIIEPTFRYRYIDGVGEDLRRTIRFDELDTVADTNEVEFALMNRFFTKSSGDKSAHEFLSIKIAQKFFIDGDFGGAFVSDSTNQFFPLNTLTGFPFGGASRDFSPITTLVRISPKRSYSLDVRGDFDTRFGKYRNFSVTGFLNRGLFSLQTTYFVTNELERGTVSADQWQARVALGNLKRGLSGSTSFSYDAQQDRLLNLTSRLNYFWDCCGVSLEYERFNVGARQENQFRFSFFLKGIGSFGTIRRPEAFF